MDDIEFKKKYMKYKLKYLKLKMLGGMDPGPQTPLPITSRTTTTPKTPAKQSLKEPSNVYPYGSYDLFTPTEQLLKTGKGEFKLEQLYKKDKNRSDIIESLYELSYFYYRNSIHEERITDLIELLSDMRHDMRSSQRKLRIEQGRYNNQYDSKTLLEKYVKKLNNQTKYRGKVDLNDLCCKYTDDDSIKIDSSAASKIGLVENIIRWKDTNYNDSYLLCGTPIRRFTTQPFLHTKDTRAADGIIGQNAILSELDGLKNIPDVYPVERSNLNSFINLLQKLNPLPGETKNMRPNFYETLMQLYFQKNIEILELEEIYNGNLSQIKITYERYNPNDKKKPYKWWINFKYYDYKFKIDVTDRGSTQNCYNLNNLNIYFEKATKKQGFEPISIQNFITHHIESIEVQENFLCIINILCGLLLKASGDDTQQALSFALSNYVIMRDYILEEVEIPKKIETTIITHDRQLTRRLLDKLLIIYKQFYNILKRKYSSNERIKGIIDKIQNSVTYKTANENIKKNLLGLCQKVYLNDDDNFPNYNYFKFHLENKQQEITEEEITEEEAAIAERNRIITNQTIEYYYTLFLYIISINNTEHQDFCKTKLLQLNSALQNNIIIEPIVAMGIIESDAKYIQPIINSFKNEDIETYFRNIISLFKNRDEPIKIESIIIKNIKDLIKGEYIDFKKVLISSNLGLSDAQIKLLNNNYTNILYILSYDIAYNNNNLDLLNQTKKNKQLLYFKIQTISQDIKIYNNSDITEKTTEWNDLTTWQDILSNIITDTDLNPEYFKDFVKYSYENIIWKIFTIDDNIIEGDVEIYINNIITNCRNLNAYIQENKYNDLSNFPGYENASQNSNPTIITNTQINLIKQLLYTIDLYFSARSRAD